MSELEIIQHSCVDGISMFFNTLTYRSPHFHFEWELICITKGQLQIFCNQTEYVCTAREIFLLPPKQVHEFKSIGASSTFLCLQISPRVFAEIFPAIHTITIDGFRAHDYLCKGKEDEIRAQLKQMMQEYLAKGPYYELRCSAYAAAILSELLSAYPTRHMSDSEITHTDKRNQLLERFLLYVDSNYQHRLSLSEFAKKENYSPSYISRFLKANLNRSYRDYLDYVRYCAACHLILAGGMRLIDVCNDAGFSDYRYFSRCFKRQCGLTPENYRKSIQPIAEKGVQNTIRSLERFYSKSESEQLLHSL